MVVKFIYGPSRIPKGQAKLVRPTRPGTPRYTPVTTDIHVVYKIIIMVINL